MTASTTPAAPVFSRFPRERTWLRPALHAAQRAEGSVSPDSLAAIAAYLAIGQPDLLIVQDLFLHETAEHAHVFLPAAAFAEKEGTFTSSERRVQRVRTEHDAVPRRRDLRPLRQARRLGRELPDELRL